jgi:hypothetical protein
MRRSPYCSPLFIVLWVALPGLCTAAPADAPAPPPPPATGAAPTRPTPAPTTGAGAAQPSATQPSPPPSLEEGQFRIRAGGATQSGDGAIEAKDHVAVETKDLTLTADSATVSPDHIIVEFSGHVTIGSSQITGTATSLEVNVETSKWRAAHARATIKPDFFQKAVTEPVYVRTDSLAMPPGSDAIEARGALVTTCDRNDPHYDVRSPHVTVLPGRKVTFEKPSLYLFGHRLFRSPINLTFGLDSKENKFIPEIGENEVEGYFAKFAYLYVMNPQNSGVFRLNLTQKRGTALGFDHTLEAGTQRGQLSVLWEPKQGALSSRLTDRWAITKDFTSDLSSNFQRNSGYYGESQTLSNNWTLRKSGSSYNSQLGLQQSLSTSGTSTSRLFSTALSHQQLNGANTDWDFRSTLRDSSFGGTVPSLDELDTSFEFRNRHPGYDWRLAADNRYDVGGTTTSSGSQILHRLPELVFNTDSDRMKALRLLGRIGTQAVMELGRYIQDPGGLDVNRAGFKFDIGGSERQITGSARLRTAARYYQSFYDDGSAQYMLGLTSDLRETIGEHWNARAQFSYSKPAGFAPITLDYWARQSDVSFQVVRATANHSRLDLSSGYDFINKQWRTALGQLEVMTSGSSKLHLQTGYDIQAAQWRPLDARWMFAHPRLLQVSLGAQYDLQQSKLRQTTMDLDWLVTPRTRVELQTSYSGFTHQIDQMDVRLTRDLHCWVAGVSYSKLTGQFQVNLGIKAFPSLQPNFGMIRGPMFQSGAGSGF